MRGSHRRAEHGWRTQRSAERAGVRVGAHQAPGAREIVVSPHAGPVGPAAVPHDAAYMGMPWQGVQWTLLLVGFLAYIWFSTTFALSGSAIPVGQVSMAIACVGLVLQDQPLRVPAFLAVFGLFIGWGALGYVTSAYPSAVWNALDAYWRVWLIALCAVNALRTRSSYRFFLFFFLAAYALYPVRGTLITYFFGGYTVFGRALWNYIYGNPNDLAALTLLALGINLALLAREPKGWPRLAALIGAGVLPLVILLTQSRGAILALAGGLLFWLAQQRGRRTRMVAVTALFVGFGALVAPESLWHRLAGLKNATDTEHLEEVDPEGSAEARFGIWRVATAVWRDHPIMGAGMGAYPDAHAVRASSMPNLPPASRGNKDTHSTYLNTLAESGVVGLALFLATVGTVFFKANAVRRRAQRAGSRAGLELLALQGGLMAFLLAGVFGSFAKLALLYTYLAVLWCATMLVEGELRAPPPAAAP